MQPLAQPPRKDDGRFDDWMFRLWKRIADTAGLAWSLVDKTGSNLTDIETRNHADLQNINTANYTHLSATNHTDLTDGGATALHKHDHAAQDNLNSTDYYHLTSAEYTGTGTGNFVRETSPTLVTPALGTPSSGTVTNLTGTASININGTVGATTPASGAFTTLETTGTASFGGSPLTNVALRLGGGGALTLTGAAQTVASLTCAHDSTATSVTGNQFGNNIISGATLTSLQSFYTTDVTLSGGATVATQYGFRCGSLASGSTVYGYHSNIGSASGRWNFYAAGTANNLFRGNTRFGSTTAPTVAVDVTGAILATTTILSSGATSGIGYTTGAGGTVTQATSRTTGVTLNKICGEITLVSAAGSTSWQSFTVTNSAVAATDNIVVNQKSGTDKNMTHVTAKAAGSFEITFATTGGTTTEQPVFSFAVIKGVAA